MSDSNDDVARIVGDLAAIRAVVSALIAVTPKPALMGEVLDKLAAAEEQMSDRYADDHPCRVGFRESMASFRHILDVAVENLAKPEAG